MKIVCKDEKELEAVKRLLINISNISDDIDFCRGVNCEHCFFDNCDNIRDNLLVLAK